MPRLPWLVRFVGRLFFRACCKFPPLFGVVALIGLGVGVWATWLEEDPNPKGLPLCVIGVGCLVFYGGLLVMLFVKLWNNTWRTFCDYAASIFD